MNTENQIFIQGPIERIYELASQIDQWPVILPHYRRVTVLEGDGDRRVVEMSAIRENFPVDGLEFPVTWRSVQVCDKSEHRIYYKHIAGIATGMWVVWELVPDPWGRGVRVTIRHHLRYPLTFLNGWWATDLVGDGFVRTIAGRTLATIKGIAERNTM